jgi:hypothetical protein
MWRGHKVDRFQAYLRILSKPYRERTGDTMLVFKRRQHKRHLGLALAILGASFTSRAVPALYHGWEDVREASDELWFPLTAAAYLLMLAFALVKGGGKPGI